MHAMQQVNERVTDSHQKKKENYCIRGMNPEMSNHFISWIKESVFIATGNARFKFWIQRNALFNQADNACCKDGIVWRILVVHDIVTYLCDLDVILCWFLSHFWYKILVMCLSLVNIYIQMYCSGQYAMFIDESIISGYKKEHRT